MTERLRHWDEELLREVRDSIYADMGEWPTHNGIYNVIADVENWQRQKLRSDGSQCSRAQEPLCECCYDLRYLRAEDSTSTQHAQSKETK